MPRFSVVIPAYNADRTLAETLDAVLAQRFDDWECVVVDDGSTDATLAIASRYSDRDPRIRVLSQANKGSGGAYNTGVRGAVGEFVVMCSSDDVLLPDHLREMSVFIDANEPYDIYSCNGYYLYPNGRRELVYGPGAMRDSLDLADVIRLCFFSVGATYRRRLFDSVGGYREEVFGEDWDFWMRTMAGGATHRYLSAPLSLHRKSSTQKSARLASVYESDIRLVEDLRESFALSKDELAAADESTLERRRRIDWLEKPAWRRTAHDTYKRLVSWLLSFGRVRAVYLKIRPGAATKQGGFGYRPTDPSPPGSESSGG